MKKINKIFVGALMAMGLLSCSQEAPFSTDYPEGSGKVLTSAFDVTVKSVIPTVRANEDNIPEPRDFYVAFYNKEDNSLAKEYTSYGEMPEIVILPAGEYYVELTYGENDEVAGFSKPYYVGKSEDFTVEVDKIVDSIKPIVCHLANVRVAVNFDLSLSSVMSNDSKVSVKVGESGSLDFDLNTKQDGYFAYSDGSHTLAATFIGNVDGDEVNETKTFGDVKPGNYYKITFKLSQANAAGPGNIIPGDGEDDDNGFVVDATVTYTEHSDNEYSDATPDENQDPYLEDDMRPENGENPNPGGDKPGVDDPDDPNNPDNPDDPNTPKEIQVVIEPADQIQLGESGNNVYGLMPECTLNVKSETGITKFNIYVESKDPDSPLTGAIQGVFGDYIDLVNEPDNGYWEDVLIPLGVQTNLGGEKDVTFVLSNFFPFVDELFDGQTTIFKIEICDQNSEPVIIILNVEFPAKS